MIIIACVAHCLQIRGRFVKDGSWLLNQTEQMDILQAGNATLAKNSQQALALALQPKYVHMVTIDPEDLSPSQLISFMSYMHEYSQVPKLTNWRSGKNLVRPLL